MKEVRRVQAAFGKAIRVVRSTEGLSQEQLGELADLHRTYIGDIERGQRNVSLINMVKIADALKVKLCVLVRRMEKYLEDEKSIKDN